MTNWLDADQQDAWRAYIRAQIELQGALARDLAGHSALSMPDFEVLVFLTDVPDGSVRITELARQLRWERSRLSHHLKRMTGRGLIAREDCGEDGRGAFAVITDAGRKAIEEAAPTHVSAVRRMVVDALDPDELEQLGAISAKIRAAVERESD